MDDADVDQPSIAVMQSMNEETVKVDALVKEFLSAQALKILPQEQFRDAVNQFVSKNDKHAMESFIEESLDAQFKEIMGMEDEEDDLDPLMEAFRTKQDALFAQGKIKNLKKKATLKPQPPGWDPEDFGPWEDQPGAYEYSLSGAEEEEDEAPAPKKKRGKAGAKSEDDASVMSATVAKKAPAKRAPAKKAPAKAPAKAKAPSKIVARKASAKTTSKGRNKGFEPSEDEDDDEDVMMLDEVPPPKTQPKRAAAVRGGRSTQTQLNFGQSQTKTQTARELSEDVIEVSDDDDEAFEPIAPSSRRK